MRLFHLFFLIVVVSHIQSFCLFFSNNFVYPVLYIFLDYPFYIVYIVLRVLVYTPYFDFHNIQYCSDNDFVVVLVFLLLSSVVLNDLM